MKKLIKNWRYWLVMTIGCIGGLLVIIMPESEDIGAWLKWIIIQECIGWAIILFAVALGTYWVIKGKLDFSEIDEL